MRSSALSLALSYVALGICALVLFAAPLWYEWQVTIREGRAEILQADAQRLTEIFNRDGTDALKNFIDARVRMQIVSDRILLLADHTGRVLAGNLQAWPITVPDLPGYYDVQIDAQKPGRQASIVHVAMVGENKLLVGRDNRLFQPLQERFWYGLTAAIAVMSIAGLLIGLITRRALMSRVQTIGEIIAAIIHGDLKHRIPTGAKTDELNSLSEIINGMLDQIEVLVHGVRDVSNSIAHDLRTPLAELRSRLEELSQTYPEIEGAVTEVDGVIRIFDALLRLAEIDAGMRRSGFVTVDAADLAASAVEFYEPAAELRHIQLSLCTEGSSPVAGDPVLLAQALSNLIDNSLKYAPNGGFIEVSVRKTGAGHTEVAVADNGPGVSAAEKTKVVKRFYRGDASRGTPGVGLGLSLVEAVAKLHGSTLELKDGQPGLRVVMTLRSEEPSPVPRVTLATVDVIAAVTS